MGAAIGRELILTVLLAGCGARSSLETGTTLNDAQSPVREAATVTGDAGRDARDAGEAASCTHPPALSLPPSACPNAAADETILVAAWMDGGLRNYSNCDPVMAAGTSGPLSDDIVTAGPAVTMYFASSPTSPGVAVVGIGGANPLQVPWYCGGPGSEIDAAVPTRLVALRTLGTCAGAPEVPGGIVLSGARFEITLNGRTTTAELGGGAAGPLSFSNVIGFTPLGYIEAIFDVSGRLISGSVLFTELGPNRGAVYCITSGTASFEAGVTGDYSLGGLRRLGSCADAPKMPACDGILIGTNDRTGE